MVRPRHILLALAACAIALAGCSSPARQFPGLANEFVYTTLSFSPSGATQTGLHEWTDPKTGTKFAFDTLLDDLSPAALQREKAFYGDFRARLQTLNRDKLDPQTQADYDLMMNAVEFALFSLDQERFTERRPQLYAENLGGALFSNVSLEYADTATRAAHLAARLGQVPAYVATAIGNLNASNEVYRATAVEEMATVADAIQGSYAAFVKGTPAAARYAASWAGCMSRICVRRARCTGPGACSIQPASSGITAPGRDSSMPWKLLSVGSSAVPCCCISATNAWNRGPCRSSDPARSPSAVKRNGVRVSSRSGSMMNDSSSWLMCVTSS